MRKISLCGNARIRNALAIPGWSPPTPFALPSPPPLSIVLVVLYRCIATCKYKTARSIKHVGITNTRARANVRDARASEKYIPREREEEEKEGEGKRRRDAHCYKLTVESLESSISSPFATHRLLSNQFLSQADAPPPEPNPPRLPLSLVILAPRLLFPSHENVLAFLFPASCIARSGCVCASTDAGYHREAKANA